MGSAGWLLLICCPWTLRQGGVGSPGCRRETYLGSWLPEPIVTSTDAAERAVRAEAVSGADQRERVLADQDHRLLRPHLLRERRRLGKSVEPSAVPASVVVFPTDTGVRRIAEREHSVVHWSEFDCDGHFAAMEVPDLLIGNVREFFRPLRYGVFLGSGWTER